MSQKREFSIWLDVIISKICIIVTASGTNGNLENFHVLLTQPEQLEDTGFDKLIIIHIHTKSTHVHRTTFRVMRQNMIFFSVIGVGTL